MKKKKIINIISDIYKLDYISDLANLKEKHHL